MAAAIAMSTPYNMATVFQVKGITIVFMTPGYVCSLQSSSLA